MADVKPAPLESFKVSKRAALEQKINIQMQIDALDTRIQGIVEKVIIKDIPVITSLLHLTHDKEELELLGRALPRVAELIQRKDDLVRQNEFLDLLIEKPETVAMLAGDFIDEFDLSSLEIKE